MHRSSFLLANAAALALLVLILLSPARLSAADPQPGQTTAEDLVGRWVVAVDDEPRRRALVIEQVDAGTFVGGYEWADYTPKPIVEGKHVVTEGRLSISATLASGATLKAISSGSGRMEGTGTDKDGSKKSLRMVKAKDDKEFHDLAYFFAPEAPITVLYVGAWDCPPCTRWNNNEKKAWMETDSYGKVTFREVSTYTYKQTDYLDRWPEDLRWVIKATHVKSGAPRFIMIAGGKVVMNAVGTKYWNEYFLPALTHFAQR